MEFDLNKYLGKWFEIARIKNFFEPDMTNVTALYKLDNNGDIVVVNEGYLGGIPIQIVGTARTTNIDKILEVSFFNNVFSDYKILFVDDDYQYAVVGGKSTDYLWILSRTPQLDKNILTELFKIAKDNEYNIIYDTSIGENDVSFYLTMSSDNDKYIVAKSDNTNIKVYKVI
jgi:lipocalin